MPSGGQLPGVPHPKRKRPFKRRKKGLHRRPHRLSPKGLARLRAALRARAAWRKAHGIKLRHRFHHRKPLSALGRAHLSLALKRAALRRKHLGLHRHLSPASRAKLLIRLKAMRHRPRHLSPAARAKLIARLRAMPHHHGHRARFHVKPRRFRMKTHKPIRFHLKGAPHIPRRKLL